MPSSYLQKFTKTSGMGSRHLALLLNKPVSSISMAAGGKRNLHPDVQSFLAEMERLEVPVIEANSIPLSPPELKMAEKQVRLLQLRRNQLRLQQESLEERLRQAQLRLQWLPNLIKQPAIQVDELRRLSANLLLRQTQEEYLRLRTTVTKLTARLTATEAELAWWNSFLL